MREMKDSGIEWTKTKVKYCCSMISGDGITSQVISDIKDTDNIYPVYGGNGQRGYYKQYNRDGNYILIGRQGALAGNVHRTQGKIWAADHAIVVTCNNENDIGFMYYLFIMMDLNRYAQDTAAQPGLAVSKIMALPCIIPNIDTQKKIATYIEKECTKIKAIETKLQHQIEVLQEYKQSVITEAVTQGIRANRPMKNSGVNWIDKIPADWDFKKITWLLDYNSVYPIGDGDHGLIKADDYLENGIPFIRVQNLGWGTSLQLDNIVYISEELNHRIANSTLHPNDIIFAKTGATIGKTAIIPDSLPISNTTSHVGKITVDSKYYPKFIFHYLSSKIGYKLFLDIAQMKTTRPEVGIEEFKQVRILIPRDIEEQKEISAYIEKKCEEIDNILVDKQKQLDTLTEYKKSLIYEYVTGKKEVPADA